MALGIEEPDAAQADLDVLVEGQGDRRRRGRVRLARGGVRLLEHRVRARGRGEQQQGHERDARGEPFLSGMFTRGEVVYAGSAGGDAHDREPVAMFTGEVLPLYAGDLDDDTVRLLLDELASAIGHALEQEEVHVGYRDRTWTLTCSQ